VSKANTGLAPELGDYIQSVTLREPEILARLREETAQYPRSSMQVSPEQGQFLAFMARLCRAKRTLEIGVFTGYSSLITALALPDDGQIIACDINDEWTAVARRYWKEAGVEHKIDLRLGPAIETLRRLVADHLENTFDFAFIDADKSSYQAYFDHALKLLRPGGLVILDNVLWDGRVIDPAADHDSDTIAIREFNRRIHSDSRVDLTLVPIGDGLTMAQKRNC
jgi:predicted O-methyltransferase YrrM